VVVGRHGGLGDTERREEGGGTALVLAFDCWQLLVVGCGFCVFSGAWIGD
jgi:hypothetical protein